MPEFKITFPSESLSQDREFFFLESDECVERIRLHDYDRIFAEPGLYEKLFLERLNCRSAEAITRALTFVTEREKTNGLQLRILEVGAGNGVIGEALRKLDIAYLAGLDISLAARQAAQRDRPAVYDEYLVIDLTLSPKDIIKDLGAKRLNCIVAVASLGFADVPARAIRFALSILTSGGYFAATIKDEFLKSEDKSGFAEFFAHLPNQNFKKEYEERHFHRLSLSDQPIYYTTLVFRKGQ